MDSIESIESSLTPGRGRGSTSPFSILLMTCRILLSAAPARASICFRVSLSALRISLSILRWASRCRRSCSRTLMSPPARSQGGPKAGRPRSHGYTGILRPPRCEASHLPDGSVIYGPSGGFLVFSGLGGTGGLRGLLPIPSAAAFRAAASPFSKLALALIRTPSPTNFARRARSTPRILEMRATSSASSTRSCQLTPLRPPDTLPDFRSRPERSTEPVVPPRGLPLVAEAARLRGEGRDLSLYDRRFFG